jgi:putative phosphoesterase
MSLSPEPPAELLLLLADVDVSRIPPPLKELLESSKEKFSQVVCLGNVFSAQSLDFIKTLNKNTIILKGDLDNALSLPSSRVFSLRTYSFAAIHGYQVFPFGDEEALLNNFNDLAVDVFLTATPSEPKLSKIGEKAFVSPGGLGGRREEGGRKREPSFCVIEVASGVEAYWYREENGAIVVERGTICQGKK